MMVVGVTVVGRVPDSFGVMAVDPGGTTGLAYGIFDAMETTAETLLGGENLTAMEVYGAPEEQAWTIGMEWLDFVAECVLAEVAIPDCHLVFESFAVRTVLAELSPVEVIAGVRTLLQPRGKAVGIIAEVPPWKLDWRSQSAGDAKSFGTSARLRAWNLFDLGRGSNHKRDALRHMALRTKRILSGAVG
jgi:hypothetical protein